MIGETIRWWIVISALGLLALPVVFTVFRQLPGRGYAFARPVGLLLAGFSYWMVLNLHLIPNRPGTIVWALLPLLLASLLLLRRDWREMREFALRERAFIIAVEAVFFAGLFVTAHLKSYLPDIGGTEKPMDFMMLNAAARSQFYPPEDAWLAGHSVSYYYFGYVIQAMVAKLSVVPLASAFNLALAGTAALAATAAFGLGYELVRLIRGMSVKPALLTGLAAAVALVLMGNLVGALEFGIANDVLSPGINNTVDINNLDKAHSSSACMLPSPAGCILRYPSDETDFWWWWRSTRISPEGNSITEFPFFSFLLGDLHPHVMAIPYVLTTFGLGLAFWNAARRLDIETWRQRPLLLLVVAVLVGGLGFLNTWDLPTFGFLLLALVLARNYLVERSVREAVKDTLGFGGPLLILSFMLYSSFYFSFSSQAAGLDTVVDGGTRPLHSFLFWGGLAVLNFPLPFVLLRSYRLQQFDITLVTLPLLLLLSAWALLTIATEGGSSLIDAITARGWNWLTLLFYGGVFGVILVALRRVLQSPDEGEERTDTIAVLSASQPALVPILIAMGTGVLLILGAELFFVKDVFASRLNTVFKLSYQAWLLLAISGAGSVWWLLRYWRPLPSLPRPVYGRYVWAGAGAVLAAAALLYPVGATLSRTGGLDDRPRTLDGLSVARQSRPGDVFVIEWLRSRAGISDRIVEAVGGQYSAAARISAGSGVPTLLGWAGHEVQWGRDGDLLARRATAVEQIYRSGSIAEALPVLRQYAVTYVIVGNVERQTYPPEGLAKFSTGLPVAAEFGDTTIYRVPPQVPEGEPGDAP